MPVEKIIFLNSVLAGAGVIAVVGSIGAMTSSTDHLLRGAMVALLIGLSGQVLGEAIGQWSRVFDTMTMGGIAALLFANRRVPTCMLERHAKPVGILVLASIVGAIIYLGLAL